MPKNSQSGFAHILGLVLLVLGIGAGVYLVLEGPKVFKPKASETISQPISQSRVAPCGYLGDVNKDNLISGVDHKAAENILKLRAPYQNPTADDIKRADVNGNGRVDTNDLNQITNYIRNTIPTFEYCAKLATPTPVPTPTPTPTPKAFGKAVGFPNGSTNSSYIKIPIPSYPLTGYPFTLETWVKVTKPLSGNYIRDYSLITYAKQQGFIDNGYIFRLSLETQESNGYSRPRFEALLNNWTDSLNRHLAYISAQSSASIEPDKWHHIAVTANWAGTSCNLSLYVNGVLSATASRSMPNSCSISLSNPTEVLVAKPVSSMGGISGYYFFGEIDELRMSNRVRYTANFTPQSTPFGYDVATHLLYHFDGNLIDATSSNLNGQMNGNLNYPDSF